MEAAINEDLESKCRGYEVEDLESMFATQNQLTLRFFSSEVSLDSWLKREAISTIS